MKYTYDVIVRPIITEKSSGLSEKGVYTFEVAQGANKVEIKNAVETIFSVKVKAVRTINVYRKPAKMGKYSGFKSAVKKAIVTLVPGQTIKEFEI